MSERRAAAKDDRREAAKQPGSARRKQPEQADGDAENVPEAQSGQRVSEDVSRQHRPSANQVRHEPIRSSPHDRRLGAENRDGRASTEDDGG
jgi:hypothetical protein